MKNRMLLAVSNNLKPMLPLVPKRSICEFFISVSKALSRYRQLGGGKSKGTKAKGIIEWRFVPILPLVEALAVMRFVFDLVFIYEFKNNNYMIIRKTERLYKEGKKKWFKHGSFDKELTYQTVKRTTIWFFFLPVCWWEKILKTDI